MNRTAFLRGYMTKSAELEKVKDAKSVVKGQVIDISPSEKAVESENYKKGHVEIDGLDITIENPRGSVRTGKDESGRTWRCAIKADYGYVRGTEGYDKDHLDIVIKPGHKSGGSVFVVNQKNARGGFDEHKCVLGADSEEDALKIYRSNYEKGWDGVLSVAMMPMEAFRTWAFNKGPMKGELK